MINSTSLPVTTGAIGTPVGTADLASEKVILVEGLTGTIVIEGSGDGVLFRSLLDLTTPTATLTAAATAMRVNATDGSASAVTIFAEQSVVRGGGGPLGPGTGPTISASDFGPNATLFVETDAPPGTIEIRISADGIGFELFRSFKASATVQERIAAPFIQAVGVGASGRFGIASEQPAARAANSPAPAFVFRPGGTRGGNVYTNWRELIAALQSVSGRRILEFDAPESAPCIIPPDQVAWPMKDVVWAGFGPSGSNIRSFVEIQEGARFTDLRMITGQITIINRATATPPISDFVGDQNQIHIGFRNDAGLSEIRNLGGAPLFDHGNSRVFFFVQNCILGIVSTSPLIRHRDGSCTVNLLGQNQTGERLVETVGTGRLLFGALSNAAQIGLDQSTSQNLSFGPVGRIQRAVIPLPPAVAVATPVIDKPFALVRCNGNGPAGDGFTLQLPKIAGGFRIGNTTVPLYTGGQDVVVAEVSGGDGLRVLGSGGDTIDSLPGSVRINARGSRTFTSDGVSNWITTAVHKGRKRPNLPHPDFPLTPDV